MKKQGAFPIDRPKLCTTQTYVPALLTEIKQIRELNQAIKHLSRVQNRRISFEDLLYFTQWAVHVSNQHDQINYMMLFRAIQRLADSPITRPIFQMASSYVTNPEQLFSTLQNWFTSMPFPLTLDMLCSCTSETVRRLLDLKFTVSEDTWLSVAQLNHPILSCLAYDTIELKQMDKWSELICHLPVIISLCLAHQTSVFVYADRLWYEMVLDMDWLVPYLWRESVHPIQAKLYDFTWDQDIVKKWNQIVEMYHKRAISTFSEVSVVPADWCQEVLKWVGTKPSTLVETVLKRTEKLE